VVSRAYESYCASLRLGGVDCWGSNALGDLGDGTTTDSDVPVAVLGRGGTGTLSGVKGIVGDGNLSYCGVLSSGRVDCWGYDAFGDLGDGTTTDSDVPVSVVAAARSRR